MLDLDSIVFRLRERCPFFNGEVYGSAEADEWLASIEQGKQTIKVPSACVVTLGFEAADNTLLNSLQQSVEEAFMVVCYFDNAQDRSGRTAASKFPIALKQLNTAILNFNALPDRTKRAIEFKGGELLAANRARAAYAFTYSITWALTAEDGYQEEAEDFKTITISDPRHPLIQPQRIDLDQP